MDPVTILIVIIVLLIFMISVIWWIKSRRSTSTNVLYSEALNKMLRGENPEAMKLLKQVVNRDSDNIGAYLHLGNLLRSVNPQQAAKIHQSLTVRPKLGKLLSKELHQSLALDYAEIKDFKRAKVEAELVLKYHKNDLWANQFLLQIAEQQHDWDAANRLLNKIQKLTGEKDIRQLADLHYRIGEDYLNNGDQKKALQAFQKVVKIDSTFGEAYLKIGNIFEEENNLKKAALYWEEYIIHSENSNSNIYRKFESTLFEQGRFNEIEQIYTRILSKKPNDRIALLNLVKLLKEKDEIEKALQIVEKTIITNDSISVRLVKVKLLLEKANPIDLGNQIDEIIEMLSN